MKKSPIDVKVAIRIWNALRKRYKLNVEDISSQQKLIKAIRSKAGLKPRERAKGRVKSIIAVVRKTDFIQVIKRIERVKVKPYTRRTKTGKVVKVKPHVRGYHKWSKKEVETLMNLRERGYSFKDIARIMTQHFDIPFTESSVQTKYYRVKRGEKGE